MPTVQEYLLELAKTAGLDDESKASLTKVLGNAKFAEELDKGVKRQSDYSRSMDELKTEKQKVEAQINQWREWYNTAVTNDAAREEELKELRTKVGSTTTTATTTSSGANGGMTKAELEAVLAGERSRLISVTKDMGRIASRHAAEFHEALDVDAVEKIALERGLTVAKAYDEYVAPRIAERDKTAWEEKLKLAREEGVREGLSKRDVPDEAAKGFHPIFGHAKQVETVGKLTDGQRATNFAQAWNEATQKK
jgi:hypothetical protein